MKPSLVLKVTFLLLLADGLFAQNKYWVGLNDKRSVALIDSLELSPVSCSDWLQSCSYYLNDSELKAFQSQKIKTQPVESFTSLKNSLDGSNLTFALEQIHAEALLEIGLTGKGVKIGIIDGGFLYADQTQTLSQHFEENRVVYYKDFVTPDLEAYGGAAGLDDNHGTEVWELIGGYSEKKGILYGMATESIYYLARTDHGGYERRQEEDFIIEAIEEMYQHGVKLINLSLGYTNEFNDPSENYEISDLNGKTSMLTQAIDIAAKEKNMLTVVAAGNDGNRKWGTLSIPADAESALTVGASKFKIFDKMDYSSIGPEGLSYLKPNLSVYATLGTSYSTPIITGLAACLMQYDSTLSSSEIISVLEKSCNFYPYGNNYVGYGVPDCRLLMNILKSPDKSIHNVPLKTSRKSAIKLKGNFKGKTVVLFNKSNQTQVMHRINMRPTSNKIKIKCPENCTYTSILIEQEVIEIRWTK